MWRGRLLSNLPGTMGLSRVMTVLLPCILLVLRSAFGALTDVESQFIEVPSAEGARESLRFITSKPHTAGTPGDLEVRPIVRVKKDARCGVFPRWITRLLLGSGVVMIVSEAVNAPCMAPPCISLLL